MILAIPEAPIAPGTITRILIEHPGVPEPGDRSIVHVPNGTPIVIRTAAGQQRPGTANDLRVGATVDIQTTGVELRSYPRQLFATSIAVVE